MIDQPRLFRNPNEVQRRETEIFSQHVAPLNNWVRELRNRLGPGAIVPWFDPWDGGCEAQILWLLEAPGPKATRERGGSGFVSCNNHDGTAQNTWETRAEAGVARKLVVHWNVIPYYLGSSTKIRAYDPNDIAAVGPLLNELLNLLPRLQVVILGGEAARKVWQGFAPVHTTLHIIECPHPSPTNLNTRPGNRELVIEAWQEALKFVVGDR
jgi:uracil-DNA glycosylase